MINTLILALCFLLLFGLAELLYHRFTMQAEHTRKIVHFGTGVLTLLFPLLLDNHWLVLFLCASFALILLLSLRFKFLPSINAIDRVSHGSISYPVAVYICYLVFDKFSHNSESKQYAFFYLPILTLAICDPIAALSGKRWPVYPYKIGKDNKTLMGSGMFFLASFFLSLSFLYFIPNLSIIAVIGISFLCGITTAFAEGISPKGFDNLSIPFVSLTVLLLTITS
jgi:phytol kinase